MIKFFSLSFPPSPLFTSLFLVHITPHTPGIPILCLFRLIERETHARSIYASVPPIGFLTDHMEVVWDLDTEAAATAAEHSMAFTRVATVAPCRSSSRGWPT
ncbi:hypothetical protein FAM14222_000196 [Propionibacterium freudenreichii]|nr:hypothetical protein [Propionibacterium freudenreichii]